MFNSEARLPNQVLASHDERPVEIATPQPSRMDYSEAPPRLAETFAGRIFWSHAAMRGAMFWREAKEDDGKYEGS